MAGSVGFNFGAVVLVLYVEEVILRRMTLHETINEIIDSHKDL